MEAKQQQIQELKDMLDSGLVNDQEIIKETKATIMQLEQEIAASTKFETKKKVAQADFPVGTTLREWYATVYPDEPVLKEVEVKKMGEDGEIERVETYLNVSARQAIVKSAMLNAGLTGMYEAGKYFEWAEKVKQGKGGKNLVLGDFIVSTSDVNKILTDEQSRQKAVNKSSKKAETKPAAKGKKAPVKIAYSWKKATPIVQLKPVVLHCQHYHLPVKEETLVALKGTGNHSTNQKAKPGEHLIFDDSGKLVYIMDAASFARKCNEPSSLDSHIENKHLAAQPEKESKTVPSEKSSSKSARADEIVDTTNQEKQDRKSPYEVLESEIKDVVKIMKKKKVSQEDADRLPAELKDIDVRVKSKATKSTLAYIEKQAKKIDEGEKLSKSEVIKLALAVQPLIRSGKSVFMDMLFMNRKRLDPTVDGLLRWIKNPSGYDLIGVDVNANVEPTVKPKRPKEDLLTMLNLK